jgi:hypothetical protein
MANGTAAGTVVASDPNSGQALTYSITSGNTNNAFSINAGTGALSVANSQALNHEITPSFALNNQGYRQWYTSPLFTGNNYSEHIKCNESPVISNQAFSIVQYPGNGTQVGIVQASDPDAGQNLTYSIISGNTSSCFAINSSTGSITVINSTALSPQTFALIVRATDNGSPVLYSQATVTITVTAFSRQPATGYCQSGFQCGSECSDGNSGWNSCGNRSECRANTFILNYRRKHLYLLF